MTTKGALVTSMDSIKAGVMTILTTIGVSFSTMLEYVPASIGKVGTIIGIVLSIVLIWRHNNLRKLEDQKRETEKLNQEKLILEIEKLKLESRGIHEKD